MYCCQQYVLHGTYLKSLLRLNTQIGIKMKNLFYRMVDIHPPFNLKYSAKYVGLSYKYIILKSSECLRSSLLLVCGDVIKTVLLLKEVC